MNELMTVISDHDAALMPFRISLKWIIPFMPSCSRLLTHTSTEARADFHDGRRRPNFRSEKSSEVVNTTILASTKGTNYLGTSAWNLYGCTALEWPGQCDLAEHLIPIWPTLHLRTVA